MKCGDPQTLERFASDLASNHALRSDLFTLCTAISHMAAEDLSGEQLLVLVARALGGAAVPKGAAVADIPESMRTAFLSGYEAWGKRGCGIDEPLAWPPSGPAAPCSEDIPATEQIEAGVPHRPGDGRRTIQEALEIARERSPNGLIAPWQTAPGTNIEQMTLGELKKLLEEIEQRVSRIDSQARPQASTVVTSEEDVQRTDGRSEASEPDVRGSEQAIPVVDAVRASRAAILPFESASRSEPASRLESLDGKFDEAFVARHPYLKPRARVARVSDAATVPARPVAVAPAAPLAGPGTVPEFTASAEGAASVASPAGGASAVAPSAAPFVSSARFEPVPFYETQYEPLGPPMRFSFRRLVLTGLVFVLLVIGGVWVYQSRNPMTMADYPELRPLVPSDAGSNQSAGTPGGAGSDAQVVAATSDDSVSAPSSTEGARAGTDGAKRSTAQPPGQAGPQVSVWPASNQGTPLDAGAEPSVASSASPAKGRDAAAAHRIAQGHSVLHVPLSTMIGHALATPKAIYPADQPKGMSGTVAVAVEISKEGRVTGAWAVSGPERLRGAAVWAAQAWRFRPYVVNGSPVEVRTTLGFYFKGQ